MPTVESPSQWMTPMVLAIALAACSSDPDLPLREADFHWIDAYCERVASCCAEDEMSALVFGSIRDMPTCVSALQIAHANSLARWEASAESGALSYDAGKASSCISQIESASCAEFSAMLNGDGACHVIGEPALMPGDECSLDYECVDGFCDQTCQPAASVDEACQTGRCATDLFCHKPTYFCSADKLADGEPCDEGVACTSGWCDKDSRMCRSAPACVGS